MYDRSVRDPRGKIERLYQEGQQTGGIMFNKLNHRIAVYIPSTENGNRPAPTALIREWEKNFKELFAFQFNGFTIYKAIGGWKSPYKGIVEENVTIIAGFSNDLCALPEIENLASAMATAMGQECVSIEVDNTLGFILPCPQQESKVA